jgi:vacuolar-type H+-ATPase subunit H
MQGQPPQAANNRNIQLLLSAEQEALSIVSSARTFRDSQLREASQAAKRELEEIRAKNIALLAEQQTQLEVLLQHQSEAIRCETERRIMAIQRAYADNVERLKAQIIAFFLK